MTTFGRTLRTFREMSQDPDTHKRPLSQGRLGVLIGHTMGDRGFSGAAVSNWELEKNKISAEERKVLIAIVKVLYRCGGIKGRVDANELLGAGNYRALNREETLEIFDAVEPEVNTEQPIVEERSSRMFFLFLMSSLFTSQDEFQRLMEKAREGPSPHWPRVVVAIIRHFSDQLSVFHVLKFVLWIWVWLLTMVLITPSLRWPFQDRDNALSAVIQYAFGSLFIPALIGALTNTKDNEFWNQQHGLSTLKLRLYTHQGASIGFHVGYFFVFIFGLLMYNFGLQSLIWVELIGSAFLVALGYASARLVPYNLFSAYKRLRLQDGRIFFVFFLVGPAWGYFFLEIYDILLRRSLGIFIVLSSLTFLLVMMVVRHRQSGTTVIPVYWWVFFWGSLLLCQSLVLLIK